MMKLAKKNFLPIVLLITSLSLPILLLANGGYKKPINKLLATTHSVKIASASKRHVTKFMGAHNNSVGSLFDNIKQQVEKTNTGIVLYGDQKAKGGITYSYSVMYSLYGDYGTIKNNIIQKVKPLDAKNSNININVATSMLNGMSVRVNGSHSASYTKLTPSEDGSPNLDFSVVDPMSVQFAIIATGAINNPTIEFVEQYKMRNDWTKTITKKLGVFNVYNANKGFVAYFQTWYGMLTALIVFAIIAGGGYKLTRLLYNVYSAGGFGKFAAKYLIVNALKLSALSPVLTEIEGAELSEREQTTYKLVVTQFRDRAELDALSTEEFNELAEKEVALEKQRIEDVAAIISKNTEEAKVESIDDLRVQARSSMRDGEFVPHVEDSEDIDGDSFVKSKPNMQVPNEAPAGEQISEAAVNDASVNEVQASSSMRDGDFVPHVGDSEDIDDDSIVKSKPNTRVPNEAPAGEQISEAAANDASVTDKTEKTQKVRQTEAQMRERAAQRTEARKYQPSKDSLSKKLSRWRAPKRKFLERWETAPRRTATEINEDGRLFRSTQNKYGKHNLVIEAGTEQVESEEVNNPPLGEESVGQGGATNDSLSGAASGESENAADSKALLDERKALLDERAKTIVREQNIWKKLQYPERALSEPGVGVTNIADSGAAESLVGEDGEVRLTKINDGSVIRTRINNGRVINADDGRTLEEMGIDPIEIKTPVLSFGQAIRQYYSMSWNDYSWNGFKNGLKLWS